MRLSPWEMLSAVRKAVTRWVIEPASPQWGRNWNVLSPRSLYRDRGKCHVIQVLGSALQSVEWMSSTSSRSELKSKASCYIFSCRVVLVATLSEFAELTCASCWAPWCWRTCRTGSKCKVGCPLMSTPRALGFCERTCGRCVWTHHPRCQTQSPGAQHGHKFSSYFTVWTKEGVASFKKLVVWQIFQPLYKVLKVQGTYIF